MSERGCSSGVERLLAMQKVVGSIPIARSSFKNAMQKSGPNKGLCEHVAHDLVLRE